MLLELAAVMRVPTCSVDKAKIVRDLNESNSSLNQSASEQTTLTELSAVSLAHAVGFLSQLEMLHKVRPRKP